MSTREWELGGLVDKDGDIGKPVPSGAVILPGKIELDGDSIRWEFAGPARWVEISPSTLEEFTRLWSEEPAAILRFAQRWGVLVIQSRTGSNGMLYRPCGERMTRGSDPIVAWQYYSRRAFAVLNIVAALNQGKLGDLADWDAIAAVENSPESCEAASELHRYGMPFYLVPIAVPGRDVVDLGRSAIANEIEIWLSSWKDRRDHGVSDFSVVWNPCSKHWELRVDYHGFLFAALALQLALCIAGAENLYTCSGCGFPYIRKTKRPKPGTANYCEGCGQKGVAQRRAVDAYRDKKAEAIRFASKGMAPGDIAVKLNTPLPKIRKWVSMGKRASKPKRTSRRGV
jgi:hypothetical protein